MGPEPATPCLDQHLPGIQEITARRRCPSIIGIPDSTWGESVHAGVVLKPGHTASEAALIDHCRTRIARDKCPRTVAFLAALPLGGVGKVRKVDLLEEWKQAQGAAP